MQSHTTPAVAKSNSFLVRKCLDEIFNKAILKTISSKFFKCRIVRPIGNSLYEVENLQGKLLGVFHAKDLKQ